MGARRTRVEFERFERTRTGEITLRAYYLGLRPLAPSPRLVRGHP